MNRIVYRRIGTIHSPFKDLQDIPPPPIDPRERTGTVEILPQYQEGLCDLEGFSHILLIYHLHLSKGYQLKVKPPKDDRLRGVFATRAPRRPNSIGISIVPLQRIDKTTLYVSNLDIVDGTPLLDIKPYLPFKAEKQDIRLGWLTNKL